jgi:hypothetical protein
VVTQDAGFGRCLGTGLYAVRTQSAEAVAAIANYEASAATFAS